MSYTRRIVLPILVTALLVGACSSGGAKAKVPTNTELRQALISVNDLPNGFTKDASNSSSDTSDFHSSDQTCDKALAILRSTGSAKGVEADFTRRQAQVVNHELKARADNATRFSTTVKAIRDDCHGKIELSGDGITAGTMTLLASPNIGDDSVALKVQIEGTTQGADYTLRGYYVVSRRKNVTSSVSTFSISAPAAGLQADPPQFSDALAVAKRADAKVAKVA